MLKYPIIQSSPLNFYVGDSGFIFLLSCVNADLTYEVNERVAVNLFLGCTFHILKLYAMLLIESSIKYFRCKKSTRSLLPTLINHTCPR